VCSLIASVCVFSDCECMCVCSVTECVCVCVCVSAVLRCGTAVVMKALALKAGTQQISQH